MWYLSKRWCCKTCSRHYSDGRDGVSNHRRLDCLLHPLFRRKSKQESKLRFTGLCEGNPPATGGFPSQRASNATKYFHLITSTWIFRSWYQSTLYHWNLIFVSLQIFGWCIHSTPLWKSNRNFFSTQIFYHLFFAVCSSFYTWYMWGG